MASRKPELRRASTSRGSGGAGSCAGSVSRGSRPFLVALAVLALIVLLGVRERQRTGRAGDARRASWSPAGRSTATAPITTASAPSSSTSSREAGYLATSGRRVGAARSGSCVRVGAKGWPTTCLSDGPDGEPGGLDRIE